MGGQRFSLPLALITVISTGDLDQVAKILAEANEHWRALNSIHGLARNLMHQGAISPPDEAIQQLHEALARALRLSQRHQLMQYMIITIRGRGVLAWAEDESETAVTLLTFSFSHPASPPPIVWRQAPQLLEQLQKELPASRFQAAQGQGTTGDLETVLDLLTPLLVA